MNPAAVSPDTAPTDAEKTKGLEGVRLKQNELIGQLLDESGQVVPTSLAGIFKAEGDLHLFYPESTRDMEVLKLGAERYGNFCKEIGRSLAEGKPLEKHLIAPFVDIMVDVAAGSPPEKRAPIEKFYLGELGKAVDLAKSQALPFDSR